MRKRVRSVLLSYGVAAGAAALALILTWQITPLREQAPYPLFLAAVALSAWYGGLGPALCSTALSALAATYFVLPPWPSLSINLAEAIGLGAYVLVAALISSLHAMRQRAEALQRQQQEWFEVTLSSIGDAVITTDAQGRVSFMNPVAESLTGWPERQAVGRDLTEVFRIIDEHTRQAVESPVAKVIRAATVVGLANHTLLIAKNGLEKPIDDSGAPIRDRQGHLLGVVLVFRDVSERRHAEESLQQAKTDLERKVAERTTELAHAIGILRAEIAERMRAEAVVRESEERYRQMFERNRAVKLLIDPESGAIVDANAAAVEFYGYRLDDLKRLKITDLNILPAARVAAEMARAMAEQRTYFLFRHRRSSGDVRDVEVHSGPIDIQGRRLLYSIVHDITEQRQAEEALQQAKDDLERKVAERTQELQTINAQLEASLHEKEVLLKEIHHRVKNNLQVICSLLSLQSDELQDPYTRQQFEDSQHRIRSMALVHETLYQTMDLARIDFAHYVRTLTTQLIGAYDTLAGRVMLTTQLDEILLEIDQAIPCGLLLNELVTNCLKHAFPDGRAGEIHIELHADAHARVTLRVSDTGIGLPQAVDFHNPRSLGLQLITTLTEQLEGAITVKRGGGTTIEVIFPARTPELEG
jgi:PAS domain S-box-containing protein